MKDETDVAGQAWRVEFVQAVLDSEHRLRDSLENRSSILIATDAVLLTALIAFGVPVIRSGGCAWLFAVQSVLTLVALGGIARSAYSAFQVLHVTMDDKTRAKRGIEEAESETNLFFWKKIAAYSKTTYLDSMASLTEVQSLEQMVREVHNLSKILIWRCEQFDSALQVLGYTLLVVVGIVLTVLLGPAVVALLSPAK